MAIDAVKIPQNVYIEDRIIGPLTLRQIFIIGGGGGFSYALWSVLTKTYGNLSIVVTGLVWIPCVIAVAFALIRVNDLSLMRIVFLMMERMFKAPVRAWGPRQGLSIVIWTKAQERILENEKNSKAAPKKEAPGAKIDELSTLVDKGVTFDAAGATAGSAETPPTEEGAITPPAPRLPVDPGRISVSQPTAPEAVPDVFLDIFTK